MDTARRAGATYVDPLVAAVSARVIPGQPLLNRIGQTDLSPTGRLKSGCLDLARRRSSRPATWGT